jgi:hypothetical protein
MGHFRATVMPFAVQTKDGQRHTLLVKRRFVTPAGSDEEHEELGSLSLSDGQLINWRAKGEYEIAETGVIVYSNDPNAL